MSWSNARKTLIAGLLAICVFASTGKAEAKLKIVTSTTDLASIAEMVGGDNVEVESICRGPADPHFVQLLPSYVVKVARADIYLMVGMDLDYWATQIIDGSQNGNLVIVDCSKNIDPVEVAKTPVDASMGDVHVQGNPHYWLAPNNGIRIAEVITDALKQVDPEKSAEYDAGFTNFQSAIEAKMQEWDVAAESLAGKEIVTYHNSWPYFARYFGIKVVGFVESKAGIEPPPSHTARLITLMNTRDIKVIGKEPYFSDRAPKSIARQTNALVLDLPTSVLGVEAAKDYFALFDTLIATLAGELTQ